MRLLGSAKKTTVLVGSHGKALQPLPGAGLEAQAPCCLSGFFNPSTCVLGATQLYVLDRTASVSGVSGIPCISQCRCKVLGSSVFMCVNMAPALCAISVKISMMPPPAIQQCSGVFVGCVLSCLREAVISFHPPSCLNTQFT